MSISEQLREPFAETDVEWRVSRSYKKTDKSGAFVLAYITSRAVMDRLDSVVGVENWQDNYVHLNNGVVCCLQIRINNEWIGKEDGAPETNFEGFKGGISDALKRAAVKWGIGRYLYDLPEMHVDIVATKPKDMAGWHYINDAKQDVKGYWRNPTLPAWALPKNKKPETPKATQSVKSPTNPKSDADQAQRFDKARTFFLKRNPEAWAKICAEQKIDDEIPACMLDSATLQNVLAAATAALGNGGKETVQ